MLSQQIAGNLERLKTLRSRLSRLNAGPREFDEEAYLRRYPDAALAVAAGRFPSAAEHWKQVGSKQGRVLPLPATHHHARPGPAIPDTFDEDAYLFFNPDVAEAVRLGKCLSGYDHWSNHGRLEQRAGTPAQTAPDRRDFTHDLEQRPYGVNLYGFLSTPSGLGSVARGFVQALTTQSIPYNPIDVPPWKGGVEIRQLPAFDPFRINLIQQNADAFDRFLRAYGPQLLNGAYNIGYWLWELPSARSDWHHLYQYVDEIWVASEFCRTAFQACTTLPVKCIPPVVDNLDVKAVLGREHFNLPPNVFVFCYIFDVSSYLDRKNPFALIEAFQREFKDSPGVLLYLKLSNAHHDSGRVRQLEEAAHGARNIRIVSGLFSEEEIVSLHNAVDCMVSPHRSEGFGFNLAEAMYFGKPVIATRYSSNLDFMNDENGYLIDCKLIPVQQTAGPYLKGSVWADPSSEHLSALLRRVLDNPDERARKGRLAAQQIRRDFSAAAIGRRIANRFEEIGLNQPKLPQGYLRQHWIDPVRRMFGPGVTEAITREIRALPWKPVISVATPVYNVQGEYLRACIESVKAQWYPFWELCLCDDASTSAETREVLESYRGADPRIKIVNSPANQGIAPATNRAIEISTGEFIALLDNDDELAPDALFEVAKALNENEAIDFLYTDEDKLEPDGRYTDHYFKPDWSPEHLQSVMYILHMMVIRKDLFYAIGGFRAEFSGAQDYDLALRATAQTRAIHHIPKVLYHWRKIEGSAAATLDAKPQALEAGLRALQTHVAESGINARVEPGRVPGHFRVRHAIPGNPPVSLCILTHDIAAHVEQRGRLHLLEHFVKSIAARTDYPNYEIVICDDGNLSQRTRKALKDIPFRVASFKPGGKPFNFAAKANFAVKQAGDYLVLLNDDMEVISSEWLTALMEYAQQPQIGAVGARLLFPDNAVQHVGVAIGVNGGAAHLYHNYPADLIGYNAFTHIVRNYSAVTAACLATRKEVVARAGGFDERLAIDYNDIDFCLSVLEAGYRIVYTPYAELYHFEGRSAERRSQNPAEVALFQQKWAKYLNHDPHYNPNLSRTRVDFSAAVQPPVAV